VTGGLPAEGDPLTLVLESVGGDSLAAAITRVAPGGLIVSFGNSSRQPTTFNASNLYSKSGARLYGFVLWPELEHSGTAVTDLRFLAMLVEAGQLDTGVDRVVDWNDLAGVRALVSDFLGRRVQGKGVLRIS
jgi:NADPH:quinone reductase-like Zn-dependent oxidoreductase